MKKIPLPYRVAAVIFILLFYSLPIYWFGNFRFDRYATNGIGRPWLSWVVARKKVGGFPDRAYRYLIFDTHQGGAVWFANRYAGKPLSKLKSSFDELDCESHITTEVVTVEGIPWDLSEIENGRFYCGEHPPGFLLIDTDTYRVYVYQ